MCRKAKDSRFEGKRVFILLLVKLNIEKIVFIKLIIIRM